MAATFEVSNVHDMLSGVDLLVNEGGVETDPGAAVGRGVYCRQA